MNDPTPPLSEQRAQGPERVIQPSESFKQTFEAEKQKLAIQQSIASPKAESIPNAYQTIDINPDSNNVNSAKHFALATAETRSKEANRLISMRVKSVLVIAIILLLTSLYSVVASAGQEGGTITLVVSLIELLLALSILTSRDKNTVGLILKIFLVFQLISLFFSFANPTALILSITGLLLLSYAYIRVKALPYY